MLITIADITPKQRAVTQSLNVAVPALLAIFFLWRIVGGIDPTVRFFDDFFYYAKAAQNWVNGSGATFFPGEMTNGYHPAWFVWLSVLALVAGGGTAFFVAVEISVLALMVGFYFLFSRFLLQVTGRRLPAAVGAAVATGTICPFAAWGLEMALVVVAVAALLAYLTRKPLAEFSSTDAAVSGVLFALAGLARLDAIMIAPFLLVFIVPIWGWRRITLAVVGAAPLALYAVFNKVTYGSFETTSMAAKSMKVYFPPNLHFIIAERPVAGGAEIQLVVSTIVVLLLVRKIQNTDARRIALALVMAPILQMILQMTLSGWTVFAWYLYYQDMVFGLAAALVAVELTRTAAIAKKFGIPVAVVALVAMACNLPTQIRPNIAQVAIAQVAHKLRDFAAQHPGVYAMGDAAGTPAWLMDQPVVHLEGLMMSHDFLKLIKDQRPLSVAFSRYHVNYFVASRPESTDSSGCRHYREPNSEQASKRAPGMWMTICTPPVAEIIGDPYHVRIYRIDPATGLPD